MKMIVSYILFFLIGASSIAQTVVTGKVAGEKGEPLPGVNVFLKGTYDGISSNSKGEFRFKTNKTGELVLLVNLLGYEPFSKPVELKGDTIRLNIQLKEKFNQLNAVTINVGTFEASDKKQAVTITPLDMMTTAGAAGDVYGALQSLPGTTINGESGRLFVKGGDSEESQTYIDGSLVATPYNSSAPNLATRGRFNPFMFKGTVFSTGGYSAEYGQALSSVLLLSTNDIPAEDQLDFSIMSIGLDASGTKKWSNGAVTGTVTYNNLAPYMSLAKQNYDWQKAPESLSGEISVRQKTGKSGMLKLYSKIDNSNFTLGQYPLALESKPADFQLLNQNQFVNTSWNGQLSEKWGTNAAFSYTNNLDDIHFDPTKVNKYLEAFYLKNNWSVQLTEKFALKFGAEFVSKSFDQHAEIADGKHDNRFTNHNYSGFTEAQIYASSRFVARIGGRVEYSDYLNSFRAMPRFSAAYKISGKSQFSAAYGWFYQNPIDDYLLYTSHLSPERADHYTFSFQSSANSRTIRAELYYKDYKSLVKLNGPEFYLPSSYDNSGSGYASGLDFFWRDKKTIKNGDYWISYSYLDTRRDYRNFPEKAVPTFASKHNFSMVYKHWFGGLRSLASVNFRYSSPRVYNNPNSTVFNGEKMPPYRSLDLSWSFLYRTNVIMYAAVTNLTGFKNEFGRSYATVPDASGVYQSAAILPGSDRFFVFGCFITLTRKGSANQLDKIE